MTLGIPLEFPSSSYCKSSTMHSNFSLGSINMSDVKELFTQGNLVSLLGMKIYNSLNLSFGECNQSFM